MKTENSVLAAQLARAIFACGDELHKPDGKVQRIQFMGGTWPDNEIPIGGLCEEALKGVIERTLASN